MIVPNDRSPRPRRPHALERWQDAIARDERICDLQHFGDLDAAAANELTGVERLKAGDLVGARHFFDCARLRLLGCYLDVASDKAKLLLKQGAGQRQRTSTWLERNAAAAADYAL